MVWLQTLALSILMATEFWWHVHQFFSSEDPNHISYYNVINQTFTVQSLMLFQIPTQNCSLSLYFKEWFCFYHCQLFMLAWIERFIAIFPMFNFLVHIYLSFKCIMNIMPLSQDTIIFVWLCSDDFRFFFYTGVLEL